MPPAAKSPPPPPKTSSTFPLLWVIGACGAAALAGAAVLLLMVRPAAPPTPGPPPPPLLTPPTGSSKPPVIPPPAAGGLDEEALGRDLYDAAEKFAKENADKPDLAAARFRTVSTAYPATTWAAKARERTAAIEDELKKLYETEFETLRRDAESKAKTGDIKGAVDAIDAYLAGNPRDILKRRAAVERAVIENDAREAFNALVRRAQDLCKAGKADDAVAAFEAMAKGAMSDVAASCAEEIQKIREAKTTYDAARKLADAGAAEDKLRADAAKALPLARERKFDEAAAAIPECTEPLKGLVEAERSALRAAADFWKAVEAGAKSHVGQEVLIKLADGKRERGKLSKCGAAGIGLGDRDIEWAGLHDDQILRFAFMKGGLAETAAESYLKAAMFFYFTGKDALAKVELATAKELGGDITRFEKVWRSGLLRPAK